MTPIGLELCDLCHDWQPIRKIYFDGKRFYCRKCAANTNETAVFGHVPETDFGNRKPKQTTCPSLQVS